MTKLRSFLAARSAAQAGFALLLVLGVIGLLSLTVVAVLSQTAVASNISLTQRAEARSNRAAESAIETAINVVRTQTDAEVRASADPCTPLKVEASNTKLQIPDLDGQNVDIYCSAANPPGDYPELLNEGPPAGRTRLVGSSSDSRGYPTRSNPGTRLINWDTNCATPTPTNTTPAPTDATCIPWRAALGSVWEGYASPVTSATQTFLDNVNPNLVHSGPSTLNFGGDVEVRSGAAVALNPAAGTGPAVNVSGQYRQGTIAFPTFNTGYTGAGQCSILSPTWGTISSAPSWIAGTIPAVAINDGDNKPECNNADAQKLRDQPGSGVIDASLAAPATWSTSSFEPGKFQDSVPACAATMYFQPGVYPAATMTALNNRIASCSPSGGVATYVFATGDYWLDTDLVVANQKANVIFGAQSNSVPKACNPAQDGVTITLRDRATITHTDGRLSICNRATGSQTALYQAPQTPAEWSPSNTNVNSAQSSGSWTTAPTTGNLESADGTNAVWSRTCSGTVIVNCSGAASATVTLPAAATSPTATLPALSVRVVADSTDLRTGYDFLGRFSASLADKVQNVRITASRTGASCTRYFLGVPNWKGGADVPLAYDLFLAGPGGQDQTNANDCKNDFRTQADLQNATVKVEFYFQSYFLELNPINWFNTRSYGLTIDQIKVVAPWAADGRNASNGAAGALAAAGGSVGYTIECTFFNCNGTAEVVPEVGNFSNSTAGYLPAGGRPTSVGVEVTGSNRYADGSNSRTRVVLKDRNGSTLCSTEVAHPPYFGQTMYLELLGPGNTGPCAGQINDVLDLTRATVVTTATGRCTSPEFGKFCRSGLLGVGYINVDVDHVRLVATTAQDTSRRGAMRVTNDARTATPASFYVDGDVSVPRRDLEINWRGTSSNVPLVEGELVLNGLASAATTPQSVVGTICCGPVIPKDRYMTLYAVINGNLKAAVEVNVSDTKVVSGTETYAPGSDVYVRSWSLCDSQPATMSPTDLAASAASCVVP